MYSRIVTFTGEPQKVEEGISYYRDQAQPQLKKMRGFNNSYLLVNRDMGKLVVVALWETEQDLDNSFAATKNLRTEMARTINMSMEPEVEFFEVAVSSVLTSSASR